MKKLTYAIRSTPWFILFSRYCQVSGILVILLYALHIGHNSVSGMRLIFTVQENSAWWSLYIFFVLTGLLLIIGRKDIRRNALICSGIGAGLAIVAGTSDIIRAIGSDVPNLLAYTGFSIPGFCAAVYERHHGKTAREEWEKRNGKVEELQENMPLPQFVRQKRKLTYSDWSVFPFFLLICVYIYVVAERYIGKGETAVWYFAGIGLILYVMFIYGLALFDSSLPISLFTSRFLWGDLALIVILYTAHILRFRPFDAAIYGINITRLSTSMWWPDQALVGATILFSFLTMILTLSRKETRKTVAMAFPAWVLLCILVTPLLDHTPEMLLLADLIGLSWVMFSGIYALLFERFFGYQVRFEWLTGRKKKAQKLEQKNRNASGPAQPASPASSVQAKAPVRSAPVPSFPVNPAQRTVAPSAPADPSGRLEEKLGQKREELLKQQKAEYEQRLTGKRKEAASENMHKTTGQLLPEAARRIYPGGEALASLAGQRQLAVWLTEGVPGLHELQKVPAFEALMDPSLPDEPEAFLPVLNDVVSAAAGMLETKDCTSGASGLSPEILTGGWFALNMYARMSTNAEVFTKAADALAVHMAGRRDATDWLNKAVE